MIKPVLLPKIIKQDSVSETFIEEQCLIAEYENHAGPNGISLARARVKPGEKTRWHRLVDTEERYILLRGEGLVEIDQLEPTKVKPGDIVVIPAGVNQRITNISQEDLLFICLCTPGFQSEKYIDTEPID